MPISSTVTVVNAPPYRSFYIHSIFHSHFHLACPADERYSLVMLIEAGHITQRRLAEAYGFDADTINNWVQRYREFGAAGLLRSNPSNLKPVPKAEGAACAQPSRLQQACLELDQETTSATLETPVTPAPPVAATGLVPVQLPETDCRETSIPLEGQPAVLDLLPVGQSGQTRYAGLLLALAEWDRVAAQLAETPAQLPYRQPHVEAVQGLCLERGAVITTLRLVAHHARTQLADRAVACFPDARERSKFLDTLIHAGGTYHRLPEGGPGDSPCPRDPGLPPSGGGTAAEP